MKIYLIAVGETKSKDLQAAIADYTARLSHYVDFEFVAVSADEKLTKALEKTDRVFLLDEKGKESSSVEFSGLIEKQMNSGIKGIAFVIGGPFGFTDEVRALSDGDLALSKMTFPHDIVRVIFLEQLYRAFTILRNEKYHHE